MSTTTTILLAPPFLVHGPATSRFWQRTTLPIIRVVARHSTRFHNHGADTNVARIKAHRTRDERGGHRAWCVQGHISCRALLRVLTLGLGRLHVVSCSFTVLRIAGRPTQARSGRPSGSLSWRSKPITDGWSRRRTGECGSSGN